MKKRLRKKLKLCCICKKKVDITGFYGKNGDYYWCIDCMNDDY
ncbi:hypothetical protein [Ectobacillus antri]|nr:hypothetical protein [Ectobacillus antri]